MQESIHPLVGLVIVVEIWLFMQIYRVIPGGFYR